MQVLQLWDGILLRLGATNARRELQALTEAAYEHHPRTAFTSGLRESVEEFLYEQARTIPGKGVYHSGQDPGSKLSLDNYRLLCNNNLSVVRHWSSAMTASDEACMRMTQCQLSLSVFCHLPTASISGLGYLC